MGHCRSGVQRGLALIVNLCQRSVDWIGNYHDRQRRVKPSSLVHHPFQVHPGATAFSITKYASPVGTPTASTNPKTGLTRIDGWDAQATGIGHSISNDGASIAACFHFSAFSLPSSTASGYEWKSLIPCHDECIRSAHGLYPSDRLSAGGFSRMLLQ